MAIHLGLQCLENLSLDIMNPGSTPNVRAASRTMALGVMHPPLIFADGGRTLTIGGSGGGGAIGSGGGG